MPDEMEYGLVAKNDSPATGRRCLCCSQRILVGQRYLEVEVENGFYEHQDCRQARHQARRRNTHENVGLPEPPRPGQDEPPLAAA